MVALALRSAAPLRAQSALVAPARGPRTLLSASSPAARRVCTRRAALAATVFASNAQHPAAQNPNNPAYWRERGWSGRPADWRERHAAAEAAARVGRAAQQPRGAAQPRRRRVVDVARLRRAALGG
jgi:hypothetical protein